MQLVRPVFCCLVLCLIQWKNFLVCPSLVLGRGSKALCITLVTWNPPLPGWIKVNTAGVANVSSGPSGCVQRCFALTMGTCIAFEAELTAAITVISYASSNYWSNLRLESDSTYVV